MIVHAYYPLGETRVQREAEALVAAGYEVDVICLRNRGEPDRERIGGIQVHRLPVRLAKTSLARQFLSYLDFLARAAVRVAAIHRRRPYATVQAHNLPDFLVFAATVPKLRGVPVLLDLHDLMPEFLEGRFGRKRGVAARLVRWQERLSCRFADHVITVSEHWRHALIERGVNPDKVSVVMNVADEEIFSRPAPLRLDEPRMHLLYHGTITHRYGLDLAVRAVAAIRDEVPGLRLTILGQGDAIPDLEELCAHLGVAELVDIRSQVLPAEALPDLIADADLGVVPYRNDAFTDGLLPTKLMEYAAMQLPCVAARTTAIARYFDDTLAAFFEPNDARDLARAIVELAHHPERRAELARGAVRFTERYNWKTIGRRYVELVASLGGRRLAVERVP
jgi:glycosyltransferase involved in cell wall biosynthesis